MSPGSRGEDTGTGDDSLPPMQTTGSPSFDLIVATLGRTTELEALLDSLERQSYTALRVIVADQNQDDRLLEPLSRRTLQLLHLRAERGLSRARNAALGAVEADIVGFPDDDCAYPQDLLERVALTFEQQLGLDGLTGRTADAMLADLQARLRNSRRLELQTAAEEQAKIMRLRLGKLLGELA